jgi:hypothetical protein
MKSESTSNMRPPNTKPATSSSLTTCQHKSVQNLIKEEKGGMPIPKRVITNDYDCHSGRSSPSSPPNIHHYIGTSPRVSRGSSPLPVANTLNADYRFEQSVFFCVLIDVQKKRKKKQINGD